MAMLMTTKVGPLTHPNRAMGCPMPVPLEPFVQLINRRFPLRPQPRQCATPPMAFALVLLLPLFF